MKRVIKAVFTIGLIMLVIISPLYIINVKANMPGSYEPDVIEMCPELSWWWTALDEDGQQISYSNGYMSVTPSNGRHVQFDGTTDLIDWNTDNNTALDGISDSTGGKDGFEKVLDNLWGKPQLNISGSSYKFNPNATFGVSDYKATLSNWAGSDLQRVYAYTTYDNGKSIGYVGCDYNRSTGKFIYYFVGLYRDSAAHDDLITAVFRSDGFYVPKISTDSIRTNIAKNIMSVIDSCTTSGSSNIFAECFKSSYSGRYKGMIDRLNSIYYVDATSGTGISGDTLTVDIIAHGTIGIDGGTTFYIDTSSPEKWLSSESANLSAIKNVIIESGDGSVVNQDAPLENAVWKMISEVTKSSDNIQPDTIRNVLGTGNLGESGKFTYEVFEYFADSIAEAIDKAQVHLYGDGIDLGVEEDPFIVCEIILQYNVAYLSNPSKVKQEMVATFSNGDKVLINESGVNTNSQVQFGILDFWEQLNDYQVAVLSQEYLSKISSLGITTSRKNVFTFINEPEFATDGFELVYADTVALQDILNQYVADDFAPTALVTGVARSCNIAARYIVATSLFTNIDSTENGGDPFAIYNATLEDLTATQWKYIVDGEKKNEDFFAWMPKQIGLFGDDSSGYSSFGYQAAGWERFVCMLYNVEYGFETYANSIYGLEVGGDASSLRDFFNGDNLSTSTPTGELQMSWMASTNGLQGLLDRALTYDFNGDGKSITLLRSIIELHEMCEYLQIGIGDWSETIDLYLQIYLDHEDFFKLLKNNPNVYKQAATGVMNEVNPLGKFFSIDDKTMSDQWDKGFALSALYVPMETNLYDATSVTFIGDPDWVSDFYYKYAFYRKGLYINTDGSAIVNKAVTGDDSGGRKVATLRDLLNYDRDIILWVDDNFYNANQVSDIIDKVDYTAIRNAALDAEEDAENTDGLLDSFGNWAAGLFDLDAGTILKTGANQYYSENLAKNVTQLGTDSNIKTRIYDSYLLSSDEIIGSADGTVQSVLDEYEYSVKQSYGVVSAIYRNAELYNECLMAITADNAIFKSSKNICKTPGTSSKDWVALYNYCMLSNLERQLKNNTNTTLDLDAPIFCDLFGNIITESGLVIIPAATNSTLCGAYWTPYTVGWSEYYNNGNRIECDELLDDVYTWLMGTTYIGPNTSAAPELYSNQQDVTKINAGGYMSIDTTLQLVLRDVELTSNSLTGIVQFEMPNKNSEVVQQLFYNDAYYEKAKKIYSHTITNMIVETLRGAPIEYINYEYESLSGNADISKYGVYMAYKLEEIVDALISGLNGNNLGGNAVVTMPNLAFVTGIEYIMLYVFKIVFALLIVALVVQLYLDATKNSLGVRSVAKFIMTCLMVLVAFTLVPKLVSWSYYKANKDLLAKEAGYIMMLNYVKEYDGSEIGITNIRTPETDTELYIRVDDVSVAWWEIIPDVLFGNTFATVTELYEDQLKGNAMSMQKFVQLKGDGLYVNVQDVFDSTNLMYTPSNSMLINYSTSLNAYVHDIEDNSSYGSWSQSQAVYQDEEGNTVWEDNGTTVSASDYINDNSGSLEEGGRGEIYIDANDRDSVVSFICPYYVILDQLVANINEYNISRGVEAYGWGVGANGHVLTYDILTPYLTSAEFLEDGFDILGIEAAIGLENPQPSYNRVLTEEDQAKIQWSLWYPNGNTNSLKASRVEELHQYARDYIADNRYIIGKVPDEVFLKVFAMQLAIKYNDIFNISNGNAIEIINVDTRDMMRFMIGDKPNVYKYYSYSFARYCYEEGGTISVIFAAFLTIIYWLTSFLKPLAMLIILALLIINCVFRKLLFRKESRCIEGYLIGCACLCLCNYLYALMLKLSMIMTDLGMGTVTALVVAFIVQVGYIAGLLAIMSIEIKDWKNSGFNEFATIGGNIASSLVQARNVVAEKIIARNNESYSDSTNSREYVSREFDRTSVDEMLARDAEREERGTFSPD